jgi:diketogulonate reductase-like aldo/keto reductase
VLEPLARSKNCSVEQLALAYNMARGLSVIPASANPDRLRTNFEAQALELTEADMAIIGGVERGTRYIDFDWAPQWD